MRSETRQVFVPRREPLPIDLEVKVAIDALEPAALDRLRRFARRSVKQLELAGEPIATDEHEQILHDASADTMSRVVPWNRQRSIEMHLFNVILRRVSNRLRRAGKHGGVSLEALDADQVMQDRGVEPESSLGRAQVTRRLYQLVRERAAGDAEVLSMLDAYGAEVTERRAVMAWTGMSQPAVVNARRRLDRLLAGMPEDLRGAALAAMRETDVVQVGEMTSEINI